MRALHHFCAELFYENPVCYVALYFGIVGVTMGAVACLGLPLGRFLPNKPLAVLAPFVVCTVLALLLQDTGAYSFAPTLFVMPGQDYGPLRVDQVLTFFAACATATLVLFRMSARRV